MNGPGAMLRDARHAKGLAIEDVERDTHIARRHLDALEQEDREALPALVYARGFLRSYAKYLGLNPNELLYRFFPPRSAPFGSAAARLRLVSAPTPRPGRVGWIVAAVFAAAIVSAFAFAISAAIDDGAGSRTPAPSASSDGGRGSVLSAGGRTLPLDTSGASDRPRTIDARPIEPAGGGEMPDFRGREVESVLAVLKGLGVPYFIVETYSNRVEAGQVLQQTPKPNTEIDKKTAVTLVVSKGPAAGDGPSGRSP